MWAVWVGVWLWDYPQGDKPPGRGPPQGQARQGRVQRLLQMATADGAWTRVEEAEGRSQVLGAH